jgi:Ni,Fe-hydrogenase III component G
MNTIESLLQSAQTELQPWAKVTTQPEPNRCDATLDRAELLPAVSRLTTIGWGYLSAITGLDQGTESSEFELLYHFCSGAAILTLRVRLPREAAAIPSVCGLIPSASLFEREVSEMLGITFTNSPDARRLYLPDDWPSDVYPLRKDAVLEVDPNLTRA